MQHLNNKYLYENEEILERVVFTKVPIIILWASIALISLIYIIPTAITHMSAVSIVIPVVILILSGIIATVKYISREVVITNKRIMYKSGILTVRFIDIPLNKIQSVRCAQTIWQRIFEYGTVIISNSTYGVLGYRFNGAINFETFKTIVMCVLDDYEYMKYECINSNRKKQISNAPNINEQ